MCPAIPKPQNSLNPKPSGSSMSFEFGGSEAALDLGDLLDPLRTVWGLGFWGLGFRVLFWGLGQFRV